MSTDLDPVSWLQIEQGWTVVSSDGAIVGSVVQVAGDKHDDIFDGLAVSRDRSAPPRYVPGEQVGLIYPGKVTLKIGFDQASRLELYTEGPPEQALRLPPESLLTRASGWLRGKR